MKLSAAIIVLSASVVASHRFSSPPGPHGGGRGPMMGGCGDAESISDFIECFSANNTSVCVDESTPAAIQECIDGLETPPTDVEDLVRNSGCLDDIKECMRENAPDRGDRMGSRIPPPIMEACEDSATVSDFIDCFVANADLSCVESTTTLTDITVCVEELETQPETVADLIKNSGCFDAVSECMKERFDAFIETLPECVTETTSLLGQCVQENRLTCIVSCMDAVAPVIDVSAADLVTCSGFQANVFEPICTTVSCCEPCVESFQEMANCIVDEYLPMEDCDFECTVTRRRLAFERLKKWFGRGSGNSGEEEDAVAEAEVQAYGNSTEDVFGGRRGRPFFGKCIGNLLPDTDSDAVTESNVAEFLGCITEHYLEMVNMDVDEGRPGIRGGKMSRGGH